MSRRGRAFVESILLHALLAGTTFGMAASFAEPPPVIRLDLSMLEQVAAPAPQEQSRQEIKAAQPMVKQARAKAQTASPPRPEPKPAPVANRPVPQERVEEAPQAPAASMPEPVASEGRTESVPGTDRAGAANPARADGQGSGKARAQGQAGDAAVVAEYRRANFGAIREKIIGSLHYPTLARRRGWSGQVEISFTIVPNGTVSDLRVTSSSGFSVLDDAALAAIRRAAPFAPPRLTAVLVMPITFELD